MHDVGLNKVLVLVRQGRFAEAETLLKDFLQSEPNDERLLLLLGDVYIGMERYGDANNIANTLIGLYPESSTSFWLKSSVCIEIDNYGEAEESIKQAINLDPYDADYYAVWASVLLAKKEYELALATADQALEIEADNVDALNIRSTALLKLGRNDESFQTIEGALREEPNNAYTHANYGWNLLEKGDNKAALEHFREALRNNPNLEIARNGMAEAIKADNTIYRLFLDYFFWTQNLSKRYQWGFLIGFYFISKFLRRLASSVEPLQPFIIPLIVLLYIFAFSTWVVYPISNLFLRFNKFGKYLLDKNDALSSNLVGISLLGLITSGIVYFITNDIRYLAPAGFFLGILPPLGKVFNPSPSKKILVTYTVSMIAVGVAGIVETFNTADIFNMYNIIFLIGFTVFQWVANYFYIKESNY